MSKIFICLLISISVASGEPENLVEKVDRFFVQKEKVIPERVKNELLNCNAREDLAGMSMPAQKWMHSQFSNHEVFLDFENIDGIEHGGDVYSILSEGFWCKIRGKPFDLQAAIVRLIERRKKSRGY